MHTFRRHQLVRLTEAGWRDVLDAAPDAPPRCDAQALDCLRYWAGHQLPLVVTRQSTGWTSRPTSLALGLPAPARWARRRLALGVPLPALHAFGEFPEVADTLGLLPRQLREPWRALCDEFDRHGVTARVGGSYGWQRLTGLTCVRAQSDIDLIVTLPSAATADVIAALLQGLPLDRTRIDGEFVFPGGAAVAWREWVQWRAGQVDRILVKRLGGVSLEDAGSWNVGELDRATDDANAVDVSCVTDGAGVAL